MLQNERPWLFKQGVPATINQVLDRDTAMMETLTAIKRAGADMILTYFAKDVAGSLS